MTMSIGEIVFLSAIGILVTAVGIQVFRLMHAIYIMTRK